MVLRKYAILLPWSIQYFHRKKKYLWMISIFIIFSLTLLKREMFNYRKITSTKKDVLKTPGKKYQYLDKVALMNYIICITSKINKKIFRCPFLGKDVVFEFQLEHCNCTRTIILAKETQFEEQNSGIENEIPIKGVK